MITVNSSGAFWTGGQWKEAGETPVDPAQKAQARKKTLAYTILAAHDKSTSPEECRISFDGLMAHDITYVSIIQTARASGLKEFPIPVMLTNCHNSLCAVGGTINDDDHRFGLSAAKRYGGDYVPPHMAVIHQYAREMAAGCGKMIIGSDSHTRYGALGCMAVGEGGGELVKQLLGRTWDIAAPEVAGIWLTGKPRPGVGPHDVALALIKAVYADAVVKNRVMEFFGPGVASLSVDYRMGIDVMTTETTCLSSIWQTDEKVRDWLAVHGRVNDYKALAPADGAWYDKLVKVDLSTIEPMIALPFHPSNAWPIAFFHENAEDLLAEVEKQAGKLLGGKNLQAVNLRGKIRDGRFHVDQGAVAGCCGGTFENLSCMAKMLNGRSIGAEGFNLSVYAASQPIYQELLRTGAVNSLLEAGATLRTSFCGPCFGAGDVPGQNCFSIRHVTRNFANREGSKPPEGQIAYVALMDARSIAATARNGGRLTAADEDTGMPGNDYVFHPGIYTQCVYHGQGKPNPEEPLVFGPNIGDWPDMSAMPDDLLLTVAAALYDKVTTTDDFVASGEPSAFRSNPQRMAEYTLQRKDPSYVGRAKTIRTQEQGRAQAVKDGAPLPEDVAALFAAADLTGKEAATGLGSVIFAVFPGDGSAREQAASCQKVLGGWANIAGAYATKRYRSNLINWGLLPFILDNAAEADFANGDLIHIPGIREALRSGAESVQAVRIRQGQRLPLTLQLPALTRDERATLLAGSLINFYRP